MDVLEIKNITYRYTNSSEKILSSINQKFQLGKFYAIIGKSGAGKSTGCLRRDHGEVERLR